MTDPDPASPPRGGLPRALAEALHAAACLAEELDAAGGSLRFSVPGGGRRVRATLDDGHRVRDVRLLDVVALDLPA